jgi:hypothetical protein
MLRGRRGGMRGRRSWFGRQDCVSCRRLDKLDRCRRRVRPYVRKCVFGEVLGRGRNRRGECFGAVYIFSFFWLGVRCFLCCVGGGFGCVLYFACVELVVLSFDLG